MIFEVGSTPDFPDKKLLLLPGEGASMRFKVNAHYDG